MHRHSYSEVKFGRQRDQRRALMKSLADSLILQGSIETTLPKAKAVASYTEKLITKAKKSDLHNRRQVISSLATLEAAHKLVDEISPKLSARNSGYFRVVRIIARRGDNVQLAKVSFVDDLSKKATKTEVKATTDAKKAQAVKQPVKKTEKESENPAKKVAPRVATKIQSGKTANQAAKRTGRRGNR